MSEQQDYSVGSEIAMPGFHGVITTFLQGSNAVIDATLDGKIAPHVAGSDELVILISGRVRATIDGEVRLCGPGDYLIIPKGAEHAVTSEEPARMLLVSAL